MTFLNQLGRRFASAMFGIVLLSGLISTAFATCTGSSPTIVCTSSNGITATANNVGNQNSAPGLASPYPSTNVVTANGTVNSVAIRLNGVTHPIPDNMDMLLVAPGGQAFVFWADVGGFGPGISNQTYTISDSAATDLPDATVPAAGSYKPKNYFTFADIFPASGAFAGVTASATNSPTPLGSATFSSVFGGVSATGTWQLFVAYDGPETGTITSWDLLLDVTASNAATTVSLTSTVNPVRIPLSGNSTATIIATVTSGGTPVTLGAVSFFEGQQSLATNVSVNSSGQASFTFNTTGSTNPVLGEGTHIITANYSGATGFSSSTSTLTQVVDRDTQVTGNVFCNTGKLTMSTSANGPAAVYPSKIFVNGLAGTTQSVVLDFKGFSHPFTDDANFLLVSPTGQKFVPFAYISNLTATSNVNITLSDAAGSSLPGSGGVATGTYLPSHGLNGTVFNQATFVSPAPAQPYQNAAPGGSATFTSTFSGASPNGAWALYSINWGGTAGAGLRELAGGWCLTIGTSSDPATTTTPAVSPTPSALSQSVTVSALVTAASNGSPVNGQGAVTFKEGNTTLAGPLNLGSLGNASFPKSNFTEGAHFIDAFYGGAPGFFGVSNGQVLHYVDGPTTSPSTGQFCNASPLTFPTVTNSSASPYPTRINVSGLAGTISKVTLSLKGLSAAFPDDVDMMLTGPNGRSLIAFSDVGGNTSSVTGVDLVLDSDAAGTLPDTAGLVSGTFRPADFANVGADIFAAPAPTANVFSASNTNFTTAFGNSDPNGIWSLWTSLDGSGGGSLANGWCVNITTNQPQLTISKSHSGNFTQGQTGAQYTVTVGSSGPGSTAGTITVVDTPPGGLTITGMSGNGWSCTVGTGTCTTSAVLAANGTLPAITVTVDVAANATSPKVNAVAVSGGGALSASTNDSTVITALPDLTISKTSSSSFVQGGTATYSLTVTNSGTGPTSGAYTISDTLPTGLTAVLPVSGGAGWDCSLSTTTFVSCVRSTLIAGGASAPIVTVNVSIGSNTASSITNTASVAGGGELNTGNNDGVLTSTVSPPPPDLTVTKTVVGSGPFFKGGQVTYRIQVNNIGTVATSGSWTVTDNAPTGITFVSVNQGSLSCSQSAGSVTCTQATVIPAGGNLVITVLSNIGVNPPASITNTANVTGGGEAATGNNAGSVTINPVDPPDLTVTKAANGTFQAGGSASYTVTVTNSGASATTLSYTVTDPMPSGLTAGTVTSPEAGWNCASSTQTLVSCTRTTALAPGASTTLTIPVTIAGNVSGSVSNTATVTGGGEVTTNNNTGAVSVTVIAPDLTMTKIAQGGPFQQGGTVTYAITVTNGGSGPTTGTITLTDVMPPGLSANSASGTNWTCTTGSTVTCTRTAALAAAANSVVTLVADIAANAQSSITNTATVVTPGESNTGNNGATSVINVLAQTAVTINVPAGLSYTFNSQTVTGSQTFNVAPGTYTLSTTTPQSLGVGSQAVFSGWSDNAAISRSVVVGSTALTITGNFTTQFQLTTAASPSNGGTVAPATGTFYDSGTVVNVTATPNGGFVFANWTGPVANSNAAATTVTMDAAKSITANFTAQQGVTINVPAGVSYSLNGQTLTGSQTVQLAPGTYPLSTTTPQSLGVGIQAVFVSWSDSGPISHNITVAGSPLTITGAFTTQYRLTTAAGAGGTVAPATGTFYDSGTVVNVTATPNGGFVFANWTGAVANANAAATTVTMDAAKSITANFTAQQGVTINVPAGVSYSLNGQTLTGSQTVQLAPGTYPLSTTTPQSLGVGIQAVFVSWSDSGPISHNITVAGSPLTITGAFTTQYRLTTAAGAGGTVAPATGTFYDSGTVVNVTATPNGGFVFANWTGPVANANAAATTVTMDAAKSITANFTAQQGVTINVPAGVSYSLNGQTLTGSQTVQLAPGTYPLSTTTPQSLGVGIQAVFVSWSDSGPISHNITVAGSPLTITGAFTTQYRLTTAAGAGGTVAPATGTFYDSGTVVNVTATPNGGFVFANWTGAVANANAAATTVTMDAAKSITANFTAQQGVTINVPAGVSYSLNGQTLTGSQTVQLAPGTYPLSTTTPQSLGVGIQAVFVSWSDSGPISHNITVAGSPLTITGAFTTQYRLTTAAGAGGTVAPATGTFYDSGTVVNVTATPNGGFVFANWTGAVANANAAATTVTMDAAKSITANFTAQQGVTINVPAGVSYSLNGQTLTGSQTVQLAPGTYPLSTTTPQSLGVGIQAVFVSWSDSGPISHNITVAGSPLTITGAFTTQYRLTTATGAGGTVAPATGTFYDSGTVVNVTATPNGGFVFANWTGAVANANAAATTVTMDAAKSITANFTAQQGVTINVPAGVSYSLNGQTLTGSQTVQLAPGTYPLSTTTPQSLGVGIQAVFVSWSDSGPISHNITVAGSPLTITGAFTTQYRLTTAAGAGGTVAPATGTFYDSGTVVNVTATPNGGFVFANWTGAVANSNAAATTVTMDAAKSITANFSVIPPAPDVTSQITITPGAATFNRATGRYRQTITIVNNGTAVGAAAYVLDNLAAGYTLFQPDGFTSQAAPAGSPYREVGPIGAGATATVAIEFTRVGTPALTYTPRLLAVGPR